MRVAFIWQRFLPYHVARLAAAGRALREAGHYLTAVEVASSDESYGFPPLQTETTCRALTCFPGVTYHSLTARRVGRAVLGTLREERPDIVFAPATPFPEGMAAIRYRLESGARCVLMDDAWELTDRRGPLTRVIKRLIHRNVDAAFLPAPSHAQHFRALGFPEDRLIFGVDVVDNAAFAREADRIRAGDERPAGGEPYFLFVGRILARKGLQSLLRAYASYRMASSETPWELVVVGDGPDLARLRQDLPQEGVRFVGQRFGDALYESYTRAGALVVPSLRDPWGLVVNEGMASGLPVLVSRGCGCAPTLVREGENGWTFAPGDVGAIAAALVRLSGLPDATRVRMSARSREIVGEWGLDRFASGVQQVFDVPRREPAAVGPRLLAHLWRGRVRVT